MNQVTNSIALNAKSVFNEVNEQEDKLQGDKIAATQPTLRNVSKYSEINKI